MEYQFTPSALRDLKRLDKMGQRRIIRKLEYFLTSDRLFEFAVPLKDESLGEFRLRVGDYRILFDLKGKTILILKIGHRKDIYR